MSDVYHILKKAKCPEVLKPLVAKHGTKHIKALLQKDPYAVLRDVSVSVDVADAVAVILGARTIDRIAGRLLWSQRPISKQVAVSMLMNCMCITRQSAESYIDILVKEQRVFQHGKYLLHPEDHMTLMDIPHRMMSKTKNWQVTASLLDIPDDIDLTTEQMEALEMVAENPISIITGGPGTGKSYIVRAMLKLHKETRVTAPTGRAARNAEGKTVHYFKTIQETGTNEFDDVSLLIVDEASMLSAPLFRDVLHMTPQNCHIVLVGDVQQLPPIGMGDVLRDLIRHGKTPTTRLSTNHRCPTHIQAFASSILSGSVRSFEYGPDIDFLECHSFDDVLNSMRTVYLRYMDQTRECRLQKLILTPRNAHRISLNKVMQIVTRGGDSLEFPEVDGSKTSETFPIVLKKQFGNTSAGSQGEAWFDPGETAVSVEAYDSDGAIDAEFKCQMSAAIHLIEPTWVNEEAHAVGETTILPSDPVIITKNTDGACNGDICHFVCESIVETPEGTPLSIPKVTSSDPGFQLAFAITVHKSQGSEFDTVILPIVQPGFWSRELLYTAVTRSTRKVVFLGTKQDIVDICNQKIHPRPSFLFDVVSTSCL